MRIQLAILTLAILFICAQNAVMQSFAEEQAVHAEVHQDGVSVFVNEELPMMSRSTPISTRSTGR